MVKGIFNKLKRICKDGVSEKVLLDYTNDNLINISRDNLNKIVDQDVQKYINELEKIGGRVYYVVYDRPILCEHYYFLISRDEFSGDVRRHNQNGQIDYFMYNYDYNKTKKEGKYGFNCFKIENNCLVKWN